MQSPQYIDCVPLPIAAACRWTKCAGYAILLRAKDRISDGFRVGGLSLLKKIFMWWDGATIGALFDIGRRSRFIGEDEVGNKYYEERKPSLEGRKRRWVIYPGYPEASSVPPMWHGWLHHTLDAPPTEADMKRRVWEKPSQPNLTGTRLAYRPKGSLARDGSRPKVSGDYEAWRPGSES